MYNFFIHFRKEPALFISNYIQSEMAEDNVNDIVIEPWGGGGGYGTWLFRPGGRIVDIHITSGAVIDSIKFGYLDKEGFKRHSETYGDPEGGSLHTITLSPEEKVIGINGTFGNFSNNIVITSLSIDTNNETYGPYGQEDGTSFSLVVTKGVVVGFHGHYGDSLDSIGVILNP